MLKKKQSSHLSHQKMKTWNFTILPKKWGKDSNSDKHRLKTEPKETLTTFPSAKGGYRSSQSHEEGLRSSSSHDGILRHFKSMKIKLEQIPSNKTNVPVSHSEHEQWKQSSLSKIRSRHSSSKRDQKTKATPHEGIEPSSSKGGCRSSRSHEEGLRCSPSPQGSPIHSTSTKTKLEQVPSNKADVHVSHSEHEACKLRNVQIRVQTFIFQKGLETKTYSSRVHRTFQL